MRRAQVDMAALVAMASNTRFLGDGGCFRVNDRADTVYFDQLRAAPSHRAGKPKQISRHHLQRMEVLRDLIHDHAMNDMAWDFVCTNAATLGDARGIQLGAQDIYLYSVTTGTRALLEDGELCCLTSPKDGEQSRVVQHIQTMGEFWWSADHWQRLGDMGLERLFAVYPDPQLRTLLLA